MSDILAKHFSSFSFLPVRVRTCLRANTHRQAQTGVLAFFIIQLFRLKIKNNSAYN